MIRFETEGAKEPSRADTGVSRRRFRYRSTAAGISIVTVSPPAYTALPYI